MTHAPKDAPVAALLQTEAAFRAGFAAGRQSTRIVALETALREARERIPDWSTGNNHELLKRIDALLTTAGAGKGET